MYKLNFNKTKEPFLKAKCVCVCVCVCVCITGFDGSRVFYMAGLCKARNKHDGDNSKTSGYQWTRKFTLECATRSCILFCYRQILDSIDEY
jgi:hypothetical protein